MKIGGKYFGSPAERVLARWPVLVVGLVLMFSGSLLPAEQLQFDIGRSVECRDITDPGFAAANPQERLVEAHFPISLFVPEGRVMELVYRIESPHRTVRVQDYSPRTTLEPRVEGSVGVQRKAETNRSLALSWSSSYYPWATASGSGQLGDKNQSQLQYELVAPHALVIASGTTHRSHGIYFKLRASEQTSLEGSRTFSLVLRVPQDWRADFMVLECQAWTSPNSRHSHGERRPEARARFLVGLYLEADAEAKAAVRRLWQAELRLRQHASSAAAAVRRQSAPHAAYRVAVLLEVRSPRIPPDWLEMIVFLPTPQPPAFLEHLPGDVRRATLEYLAAKQALVRGHRF